MSLIPVIEGTRRAVAGNPAVAQAVFTAQGTLVGVTEVNVRTGSYTVTVDEPIPLGGTGLAANPLELALASLASCKAITARFWAAHLGISFDSLTVRVEGDADIRGFFGFDDTVRPGFSAIRVTMNVTGPDTDRYAELAAAVMEHSPIGDVFKNPIPVTLTLNVSA